MSGRPPEILERFVTYLIPRGCRENVAGDLREQYRSTAQYLVRALRIMPVVIASRDDALSIQFSSLEHLDNLEPR